MRQLRRQEMHRGDACQQGQRRRCIKPAGCQPEVEAADSSYSAESSQTKIKFLIARNNVRQGLLLISIILLVNIKHFIPRLANFHLSLPYCSHLRIYLEI